MSHPEAFFFLCGNLKTVISDIFLLLWMWVLGKVSKVSVVADLECSVSNTGTHLGSRRITFVVLLFSMS